MKTKLLIFFSLLLLITSVENAWACSCSRQEVCQYFSNAKSVFVGKVLDSTEKERTITRREMRIGSSEWEENKYIEKRQISKLAVEESFFGTDSKKEIIIETEISSSCALPLQKGVSYLIYASPVENEESLMTFFCSGTKPVSSANEDLAYLRANKSSGAIVAGKTGFGDWWKLNPALLAKYNVTTISLSNQQRKLQTAIQTDGSYKFSDVPNGKYQIKILLPDILTTRDEYNPDLAEELEIGDQSIIEVSDHGCIKKNFLVEENGRISGRITDSAGNPVEDITVYLVPVSKSGQKIKQKEECYDNGLCLDTRADGKYFFKGLKSGRYLVGVRLDNYVGNDSIEAAFLKTYYPGVALEKKAVPVVIETGKQTENINFVLARRYREQQIKGRVFFKDGRPAAKVNVRYIARTPDSKDNGITFIKTDDNGYFSITGYENHSYLIGAFTEQRNGNENSEAMTVVVSVLPSKALKEVKLVLDQIGDCPKCGDFSEFPRKTRINR